jgi:hypothetical protein
MLTARRAGVFIYRVQLQRQRWCSCQYPFRAAWGWSTSGGSPSRSTIYLRKGATPNSNVAAAIINILKLAAIFIVLFVVIRWQVLNVFGLVGGLSLCFLAILWQGLTLMKNVSAPDQ